MPRYHFHLESRSGPSVDIEGREIADDAVAVQEARDSAIEVLQDDLTNGHVETSVQVTVDRSDGTKVALVKASARVETF